MWNYDGSSTNQEHNHNTEVILKPVRLYKDFISTFFHRRPLFNGSFFIFCETYDINMNPHISNTRNKANILFNQPNLIQQHPWYGLEQEYFMIHKNHSISTNHNKNDDNMNLNQLENRYYCGVNLSDTERKIAHEHLEACLHIGLNISGINAEVSPNQWEFQIGPCEGIQSGDHLYMARFLLERIAEKYDVIITYHPKPFKDINGSGCHVNFSTRLMRDPQGLVFINSAIEKLSYKHKEHIDIYGNNNDKRLTGIHETSSVDTFTHGVGTRHTSIRIPNDTFKNKCGYLEDRRPGSNIDPYVVTSKIFDTCCN